MDTGVQRKIDSFFTAYPKRSYPKGQILIFINEAPEHAYYVKSGVIKVFDITYRGEEVIVNLFKNPAFFPMSWVLNETQNRFYYVTDQPSVLHIIPVRDAYEFLKNNPDVTFDLLRRVYRGIDGILERTVLLMAGSAKSRLLSEIIIDCKRFAEQISEDHFVLSTNEIGLASRTGLSRETISRELNKLKRTGAITTHPKSIEVLHLTKLEKLVA